jgi:tetratricopeptide (TPR) repeat protein
MKNKNVHPAQAIEKLNSAFAYYKAGNLNQAIAMCMELNRTNPKYVAPYNLLGVIYCDVRDYFTALDVFTKCLEVNPKNEVTLDYRGNVYVELKQIDLAIADFTKAIKCNPKYAKALFNRGCVYQLDNKMDAAITDYRQALKFQPYFPEAINNLGAALLNYHKFEEALELYSKALSMNSPVPEAFLNNRALVLQQIGRVEEALEDYTKALKIKPDLADAQFNRSMCLLTLGDKQSYAEAWKAYESRFNKTSYPRKKLPKELWDGSQCLNGKTIFVYGEQGIGDTLQFCRLAKLLKEQGAKTIFGVQKEVVTLLQRVKGIDVVVKDGDTVPEYDYYCPMFSLNAALNIEVDIIPKEPYLSADPQKVHEFSIKMGNKNNKLRVGIVWSGGFRPDQPEVWAVNERRNIALEKLKPLQLDNVEYYSLQKGEPAESELAASNDWDCLINYTKDLKSFDDTAALIANLDLVIAVDTSTMHLAAGMGKEVWLLNRFDTCYRWFLDRTDSPWYPTVTIFRQPRMGDWDSVIQQVKEKLNAILQ